MEELSTKTRIIVGAVACIEQDGLHSLTIRKIAEQADVNVAAVNYHFGTKANLINEVLKSTTEEFVMLWPETADSHDTPREHLRKFCQVCMDGALLRHSHIATDPASQVQRYVNTIKAYGGLGVIDWHVRAAYPKAGRFRQWGQTYLKILDNLAEENDVWVTDLEEIAEWLIRRRRCLETDYHTPVQPTGSPT